MERRASHEPCELCAVRALRGERAELAIGMTFVPVSALKTMRWGRDGEPESLLPAATRSLGLDFVFVPSSEPWAEPALEGILENGAAPLWVVEGPFSAAIDLYGWTEALRLTVADPETLSPILDRAGERSVSEALRGLAAGAAGVVVAQDVAGASGPLMPPDFVHEEILPRAARVGAEARRVDLPTVFHSDGDVRVFLPAIARAGFAAVHAAGRDQDSFVRLLRDARRFDLRVVGGIDGDSLREGVPAAMRAGVQAALFAAPGDVLIADDGSISTGEELAAFVSAIEAARGGEAGS